MAFSVPYDPIVRLYEDPVTHRDYKGRSLLDIYNWSDSQLEGAHDYIQLLFPLSTPSPYNPNAALITDSTREQFRSRPELQSNMRHMFSRMLKFFGFEPLYKNNGELIIIDIGTNFVEASQDWLRYTNHNHKRMSRIIESLATLGLEQEAKAFFAVLEYLHAYMVGIIESKALTYWRLALERGLSTKLA